MNSKRIAQELLNALDRGVTIASVVTRNPGFDWDQGYAVAAEILALRCARGESPVGRKIGFTNRNIWPEYGATAPIWAHIYRHTLIHARDNAATISLTGSVHPKIEPEIAFGLSAPLPVGTHDPEHILQSVAWYAPSFEIVDCHFADWKFLPADAAADFSFHWRLIVGTPVLLAKNAISLINNALENCRVTLSQNGALRDRGLGANALDHPCLALAFLADIIARQRRFDAPATGEIITTGTLTAAFDIHPGETWSSSYEGLQGVQGLTLRFTG
jgi:2-oxo-3-hexenedioate decarboxylase